MKTVVRLVILAVLMVFASTSSALTMSDVIQEDTLLSWGTVSPNNPTNEAQWVADELGIAVSTITYSQLDGSSSGINWIEVTDDSEDLYAFDFTDYGILNPDYFLIKTGNNVGLSTDSVDDLFTHYLYNNLDALQYGVINLLDFEGNGDITIDIVSHVGTTGGTPIPEPGTLLLLGSGLTGLAVYRLRSKK